MIYGAMRDKDVPAVARVLFPKATKMVFTAPDTPRAMPPAELRTLAGRGHVEPNPAAALKYVHERVAPQDAIVITGSLFLVGEARRLFVK